jgi:hypothetical protein
MNKITKFAGVAAVALALTQTLQAIPVTGNIGFTGAATLNTSSAATATGVITWLSPVVNLTSGSFTVIPNTTPVTFASPWLFAAGASPFWSVSFGGETFVFNLLSSSITSQGGIAGSSGFVIVNGTGTVSGSGNTAYSATTMSWSFSTQDPKISGNPDAWTFSASTASVVPDGGSTALLLGAALSSLTLLKRKFMA